MPFHVKASSSVIIIFISHVFDKNTIEIPLKFLSKIFFQIFNLIYQYFQSSKVTLISTRVGRYYPLIEDLPKMTAFLLLFGLLKKQHSLTEA